MAVGFSNPADCGHVDHEQENVRHIELPNAPHQFYCSYQKAFTAHGSGVGQGRRVARYEDKKVGSVAKAKFRAVSQATALLGMWSRKMAQLASPRNKSRRKSRPGRGLEPEIVAASFSTFVEQEADCRLVFLAVVEIAAVIFFFDSR